MIRAGTTSLRGLLDLERLEVELFRGAAGSDIPTRVFGGQVVAQALVAAGRTVPTDRPVHSLHAYFLRPGDPAVPTIYAVDRIRDGRSFTTRRVVAVQHGEAIFHLSASFHRPEQGLEHQRPVLDVLQPEELPPAQWWYDQPGGEQFRRFHEQYLLRHPVELRFVDAPPQLPRPREPAERVRLWIRVTEALPEDPLVHAAAATYASDMFLLGSALAQHGIWFGGIGREVVGASLDHAMWFHAPVRADDWLFYDQDSPWAGGARGLTRGVILRRDGTLAASVVQEGLLRLVDER